MIGLYGVKLIDLDRTGDGPVETRSKAKPRTRTGRATRRLHPSIDYCLPVEYEPLNRSDQEAEPQAA